MDNVNPDTKAASEEAAERGEATALMEPLRLSDGSRHRSALGELAVDLAAACAGFRRSLPLGMVKALADLVREMNCYYSNLIEGHDTHPVEIERALKGDYSSDPEKRDLQLEAKAHVVVQEWIDTGGLRGRATTMEAIRECHKRFGDLLPAKLLRVKDPDSGEEVVATPGELRQRDVQVGRHVPVSPGAVPRFLERFEAVYGDLGRSETILAAAAAHHRLLWIHPFLDGNGRVARLMSHALLLETLDTGAVWSIARGLARNESRYKEHLANCDLPRRNDLDGRGPLSEEALADFTRFFLETCIDQVDFMASLLQPSELLRRMKLYVDDEVAAGRLPSGSLALLREAFLAGELARGNAASLTGYQERRGRQILAKLLESGLLISQGPRAPVRLGFPIDVVERWFPNLYPVN